MCTINKSAHTKKYGNLFNDARIPTFEIQCQIHHISLLPLYDVNLKYVQMYFVGGQKDQIEVRCSLNQGLWRIDLTTPLQSPVKCWVGLPKQTQHKKRECAQETVYQQTKRMNVDTERHATLLATKSQEKGKGIRYDDWIYNGLQQQNSLKLQTSEGSE